MVFNSGVFLIFFGVFFFLYWALNNRFGFRTRNLFTLISSYVFYGWWDWRFLSLIIVSSLADFLIGIKIDRSTKSLNRKMLLFTSISINLGILGFFKYYNFFSESLVEIMSQFGFKLSTNTLNIILPVGISFYTFQTLSYTIDIYKQKLKSTTDIISFFSFVSFFPQLVAGPIERASHLLNQFNSKKKFSYDLCIEGLRLTLWGFFKKIVIADNFGVLADRIFDFENGISGITVIAGVIFFGIQIYADFSGYSDIAIGISRMLGYDLITNFKTPYFARTFQDFWKRWHISLSSWFRDYVYIPLGGNKSGSFKTYFNLMLTFLLSGLWHGANYTFLIWGGMHAVFLIIEKIFKPDRLRFVYYPILLASVLILWLPFRAEDTTHLMNYMDAIFSFSSYSLNQLAEIISFYSQLRFLVLMAILGIFLYIEYQIKLDDFNIWMSRQKKTGRIILYYVFIVILIFAGNFSVKPDFIYFQF